MIIHKYNSEEEWLEGRRGAITGTRAGNLSLKSGKGKKKGFYEIIAEKVAIPASGENVMDRGHRLETVAIERFSKDTGIKVNTDLVIWSREDCSDIAISPDGYIETNDKIESAIEVKCLSSASHIEAWLTKRVPDEYEYQSLQYFAVNDNLKTLYFVFYDPRCPVDMFYFTITRESVQVQVDELLKLERETLVQIEDIVSQLTF